MDKKVFMSFLFLSLVSTILFLSSPDKANASFIDTLINKDKKITAGDTIKFTYIITNQTNKTYSFLTLKTNSKSNLLNSLRSLSGATSISNTNGTITIPNIRLLQDQQLTISFEANTNLNKSANQTLTTEPELVDQNNVILVKGNPQKVIVKKMSVSTFNTFTHTK